MREEVEVTCPACHERIPLTVNPDKGSKTWVEECCVCDSEMTVRLVVDEDDEYTVSVKAIAAASDDDGEGGDSAIEETKVTCPACWEEIELSIDLSAGSQTYSEDCSVCCRPMTVKVWVSDDMAEHTVDVEAENE